MRRSVRLSAPLMAAALALGGLAVAVAPSAAACGGYGQPACQTFTLSFNANGGVCNPASVSATENTWATLLSASQCTRADFTLTSWLSGVTPFEPGQQVFVTGNAGFTAVWTSNLSPTATPTGSPTASPTGGTSTPTASPTGSPTVTASIPPGQTNPDRRVVVAPGVVLVNNNVAERTEPTELRPFLTAAIAGRNRVPVVRGAVFQPEFTGLRDSLLYRVALLTPRGETVDFGEFRADGRGSLLAPAIRYTEEGGYAWTVGLAAGGSPRYLYLRVR